MFCLMSNKSISVIIKATEGLSDKAFDTGWRIITCHRVLAKCKEEADKLGLVIIDNEEFRDIFYQDSESMDFYVRVKRNKPVLPIY